MAPQSNHNLPALPNVLLGREQELKTACEQLLSKDTRLLSLTGPPGVGKTRLAMAVAESVLDAFPDGVRFIDLAPLQDAALVEPEVAKAFGIASIRGETMQDILAAYLRDRQVLLILDNFEGVLTAASWVGRLLERTAALKILATSRERLRLRWEKTILVPPLPLPDLSLHPDLSALAGYPSITLYIQRATAANINFTLSLKNADDIAALCTRLDGLPLAIELAAAHANVLSPAEILANMDDRFRLLSMGAFDLPERHQTLRAAIDWSYELLPPAEGQYLRRLAVFSGGFSLKAAEIVGDCEALELDGLASLIDLVEKNLVIRAQGPASEPRFTLLESIRDYLLEKLRTSGELEETRQRHAEYYLELAERNYSERKNRNQKDRFDLLEAEHDNLRAALQWSMDARELLIGKRISVAIWNFWWLRGHIWEGVRWLETFLNSDGESRDEVTMSLLEGAGTMRGWQQDYHLGKPFLMRALQIAQEQEDGAAIAMVLFRLCVILWVNGKTDEANWLAEEVKICSSGEDSWELAHAFLGLGNLLYEAGFDEAAENALSRSLKYFQIVNLQHGTVFAGSKLAVLQYRSGNVEDAHERMVQALKAAREPTDLYAIAYCIDNAAQLVAQRIFEPGANEETMIEKIVNLFGAVDHWRMILSLPRGPREESAYQRITANLKQQIGEDNYLNAWQAGQSIPPDRVIYDAIEILEAPYPPLFKSGQSSKVEEISIILSERERQVIGLVAEGLTNQEIADRLFITERTVRFHITSIFNKLGANNRTQAVAIADRIGVL